MTPPHPSAARTQRHSVEEISDLIAPSLTKLGVALVGVRWTNESRRTILQVLIDTDAGVTIEECATASNMLTDLLDVYDVGNGPYDLQVSSPGAERPLITPHDWERAVGRKIRVDTKNAEGSQERLEGKLIAIRPDSVELEIKNKAARKMRTVTRSDIVRAKIVVDI